MSVQANTYIMRGALFSYDAVKSQLGDDYDAKLEPYMDSAFKGVQHRDGLCVLCDGMNGKYVAIGQVIAKTENHQGFDEVYGFADGSFGPNKDLVLKDRIEILTGINDAKIEWLVLTHYR